MNARGLEMGLQRLEISLGNWNAGPDRYLRVVSDHDLSPDEIEAEKARLIAAGEASAGEDFGLIVRVIVDPARAAA